MNSARSVAAIFASLALATGTFVTQSSGADEMMGRHSMEGKVTSVDEPGLGKLIPVAST